MFQAHTQRTQENVEPKKQKEIINQVNKANFSWELQVALHREISLLVGLSIK